jgi:HAD superfamily hydrolase (TIGR01549 family)
MYPVRESLHFLLPDDDQYNAAWNYCGRMDFRAFHGYLRQEPGIIEVLELAKSSYQVALATNRTVSTREVLAQFHLDKYFDLVVSALDVQFPKPHPESMERILDTFGLTPQEILYVGDSAVDEALATATGVYFAAYKNPKLKAHLYVSHFEELFAVLSTEKKSHKGGSPSA